MKEQLRSTWTIHNDKNLLLIQALDTESLQQSNSSRGRTVGQQFAHMHNTRLNWLEHVAKKRHDKTLLLDKKQQPDKNILAEAFTQSAEKIAEVIQDSWEEGGKLPAFKTGLIPFIGYLISHESHHRGNILLTLKLKGIKLPEAVSYGLWQWDR